MSVREILAALLQFETISGHRNLDLIAWVEAYLARYGVRALRLDQQGECVSLLAKIGPDTEGGMVFSGHVDVVPVSGQPWSRNPFVLHEQDGRYYGRGTCDMKGFIACVLSQVPHWVAQPLQQPIYIALTRDEEIGCLGAGAMAKTIADGVVGEKPFVVIGEPTMMLPVVAQKGITNFRTTVIGQAAHSSQVDQGVSAVHVAARLVQGIEEVMDDMVAAGEVDEGFAIPYSSLHVGVIQGGVGINVKAQSCTFDWEIRHLPTQGMRAVFARVEEKIASLQKKYPNALIQTECLTDTVHALANRDNKHLLALVMQSLPMPVTPEYVAYATEAGMFQQHGFEVLILGPGSIRQAHQADEWIEHTQLALCEQWLRNVSHARCLAGVK